MNKLFSLFFCVALLMGLSPSVSLAEASNETARVDARLVLHACEGMVEQHLQGVLHGLKALAATQDATSGSWERIKPPLEQFSNSVATNAAMWFARPDGSYFTVEKGLVDQNIKDRDYFSSMLLKGKDVIGALVVSRSTGHRIAVVATPIMQHGKVTGILGASISMTQLAKLVTDELDLPSRIIFYALDANGMTALHRESSLIFQFPSEIGDQSLKSAVKEMLSKPEGVVRYTYQDTPREVMFRKSEVTGWVFALGISEPQ